MRWHGGAGGADQGREPHAARHRGGGRLGQEVIDREKPAKVFIDVGGVGAGVYDQLKHMGPPYSRIVEAVNFGSAPFEPPPLDELGRPSGGPLNRRAEMWMKSKAVARGAGRGAGAGFRFPAGRRLRPELPLRRPDPDRAGEQGGHAPPRALSPDEWDAVALTFARPVAPSNFNRRIVYPPSGLV